MTLDGRDGTLATVDAEAGDDPRARLDIIVTSVDLKLRAAIELVAPTGNPIILVDQLGRLAGLCGDEEIYRGLLHREGPSG